MVYMVHQTLRKFCQFYD